MLDLNIKSVIKASWIFKKEFVEKCCKCV